MTHQTSEKRGWEIRRDQKVFRFQDPKQLLKIRAEGRFKDGDQVRPVGQKQWRAWQELPWHELEQLDTAEITAGSIQDTIAIPAPPATQGVCSNPTITRVLAEPQQDHDDPTVVLPPPRIDWQTNAHAPTVHMSLVQGSATPTAASAVQASDPLDSLRTEIIPPPKFQPIIASEQDDDDDDDAKLVNRSDLGAYNQAANGTLQVDAPLAPSQPNPPNQRREPAVAATTPSAPTVADRPDWWHEAGRSHTRSKSGRWMHRTIWGCAIVSSLLVTTLAAITFLDRQSTGSQLASTTGQSEASPSSPKARTEIGAAASPPASLTATESTTPLDAVAPATMDTAPTPTETNTTAQPSGETSTTPTATSTDPVATDSAASPDKSSPDKSSPDQSSPDKSSLHESSPDKSLNASPSASSPAIVASAPQNVLASPAENADSKSGGLQPAPTPTDSATTSASATNELDPLAKRKEQIYQQIVGTVEHHRNTYANLREERANVQKANNALAKINAEIELINNRVAANQAVYQEARQVALALLTFSGLDAQQRLQRDTAQQTMANMEIRNRELRSGLLVLSRNRDIETANLQKSVKQLTEVVRKEELAIVSLMDAIDLFEEIPEEVHQRLFDDSQQWMSEEQDLFIAYLLNSAAAVRMGKLDIPDSNYQKMAAQVSAIAADEAKLRSISISRFFCTAWALSGLAKAQQKDFETSFKLLRKTLNNPGSAVDFWMLRGRLGMKNSGVNDANSYFQHAISDKPSDPRVYRYFLQALLTQDDVPQDFLKKLLQKLVSKSTSSQAANWLIAAQTSLHLGDTAQADQYLAKIDDPLLTEQVRDLKQAIAKAKSDMP